MKILVFILLSHLALLFSCDNSSKKLSEEKIPLPADINNSVENNTNYSGYDTVFYIFNDNNYIVEFKSLAPVKPSEEPHSGTLSLIHKINSELKILIHDTLDFFLPKLQLKDFNNDKIKDILILNSSGARSNWTHHLYLVDNTNHTINKVKGFEEINNPEFDSIHNIVQSLTLSGVNSYSFYRINETGNLIDLGNSFEDDGTSKDNQKYNNAMKNILKRKWLF